MFPFLSIFTFPSVRDFGKFRERSRAESYIGRCRLDWPKLKNLTDRLFGTRRLIEEHACQRARQKFLKMTPAIPCVTFRVIALLDGSGAGSDV